MNKDYGEIENKMLLYKSKETIVKEHIELLKRIDKAIYHLDFFISDTNLSKYDTLKILMHAKKILKGVDKEVE